VMMPRMDGIALLTALRADPRTQTMPVILLSARAGEDSVVDAVATGADDYVVKPFSELELCARVRTHLELARLRREPQLSLERSNRELEQRVAERTASLLHSESSLATSERLLRALTSRILTIQEQERTQLSREIHDVLGQELTGLKMDVAWVLRREADEAVRTRLKAMLGQLDEVTATVRRIATSLHPTVLDDIGLAAAMEWQAKEFEARSGIAVELELPTDQLTIDIARATAAFRIFQELLTNVARHSGASTVRARLAAEEERLVMEVNDNGRGIADEHVSGTSLGLLGIRERAKAFDGTFEICGSPGLGTSARISLNLDADARP